eukprot:s3630_g7.t1
MLHSHIAIGFSLVSLHQNSRLSGHAAMPAREKVRLLQHELQWVLSGKDDFATLGTQLMAPMGREPHFNGTNESLVARSVDFR